LTTLLTLFLNNLFPILLIAAIGFVAGKILDIDPKSLSRVVFYILSPFLIFDLLANSQLSDGDILRMVGFSVFQAVMIGTLTFVIGRALKLERKLFAAVLISTLFINAGNYGLSLNLFAFGETAVAHASLFFVTLAFLAYSIGVTIASLGTQSLKQSLSRLAKIPTIYAAILGIIFNILDIQLPIPLERASSLLSGAAIPGMILLLGLQLQRAQSPVNIKALVLASSMRLIGGAVLAIATVSLFGLQGVARQAGILQAAMPTAVLTTVLATEFDAYPSFVTSVVFITTILSPLTLTPLLAYLGA
jgi:predicted permease